MTERSLILSMTAMCFLCFGVFAVRVHPVFAGESMGSDTSVIFLHHSTGNGVWNGGMPAEMEAYNTANATQYQITERSYPSGDPYPWNNYPYDYWNLWINHGDEASYMEEPTLDTLTASYDVIVWKHCYPVSNVVANSGSPDISSPVKSIENYTLQYEALKEKMHEYPDTRFVVWTGAALVENNTSEANAQRAEQFFDWVKSTWDEPGDNIFIWDFWELETEGGLYLKNEYASSESNSHPNSAFNQYTAPLMVERIIEVIEGRGDGSDTAIEESEPEPFLLHGAFPNPFNPTTTISFSLDEGLPVRLGVYSLAGQKIADLIDTDMPVGNHSVVWNGKDGFGMPVSSGIYLIQLQAGGNISYGKMTLVK